MIAAVVLAALVLLPGVAGAAPLAYKGVPLGTPMEEARRTLDVRTCSNDGTMCLLNDTTYAGESDVTVSVRVVGGRLEFVMVTFKPASFGAISQALASRYGAPASDVEQEYRTVGGAVAQQRIQSWDTEDGGAIVLRRYGRRITEGRLTMGSAAAKAASQAIDAERKEKAKGDI